MEELKTEVQRHRGDTETPRDPGRDGGQQERQKMEGR